MSLRLQLIVAFLLLAVLPLLGIVVFSYETSRAALRRSTEMEAKALAETMEAQMNEARQEFTQRFEGLGALPFMELPGASAAPADSARAKAEVFERILGRLGGNADLIESFEFVPAAPESPDPPTPPDVVALPSPSGGSTLVFTDSETVVVDGAVLDGRMIREDFVGGADGPSVVRTWSFEVSGTEVIDAGDGSEGDGSGDDSFQIELHVDPETGAEAVPRFYAIIEQSKADEPLPQALADPEVEPMTIAELEPTLEAHRLGEHGHSGETEEEHQQHVAEAKAELDEVQAELEEMARVFEEDMARLDDPQERTERRRQWQQEKRSHQQALRARMQRWQAMEKGRRRTRQLMGQPLGLPVVSGDSRIGEVRAQIRPGILLRKVLSRIDRSQGEVPFVVDSEGELYVLDEADRPSIEDLIFDADDHLMAESEIQRRAQDLGWVLVHRSATGGLELGIARPISESLGQVSRAAQHNFVVGLGLIALALLGVVPLSSRITRNLREVTASVGQLAEGDRAARLPVRSRDEVGQLAMALNDMAGQLADHEERLVEDERRRGHEEVERKLLEAEYARKSHELEEARQFQLSLLPKRLPDHSGCELAVHMETATEVGGDYYDFRGDGRTDDDAVLAVVVGDATGHGAKAGTMVTVTKSLFASHRPGSGPAAFLASASETIRRMELGRMAMALTLAEVRRGRLVLAAAGMPPALLFRRATATVEEITLPGLPLGSRLTSNYAEQSLDLDPGDTLLLLSDGFPELPNAEGEPFGYPSVRDLFCRAADADSPRAVIQILRDAARDWRGDQSLDDDMTFVVLRAR